MQNFDWYAMTKKVQDLERENAELKIENDSLRRRLQIVEASQKFLDDVMEKGSYGVRR